MRYFRLTGARTLRNLIAACRVENSRVKELAICILRCSRDFAVPEDRLLACEVSAAIKRQALCKAGFPVQDIVCYPHGFLGPLGFTRQLELPRTAALVIQRPFPPLGSVLEALTLGIPDLDRPDDNHPCAAAEATLRLWERFHRPGDGVAVVGSRGFVGRAVVSELSRRGYPPLQIDKGDSLASLVRCPTIIACAGVPNLVAAPHLRPPHRLVLDVGFNVKTRSPLSAVGDVERASYPPDAIVTPVPGGIGPFQVAVLLERALRLVGVEPGQTWDFSLSPAEL